jgi:protein translocase SecG subunit
MAVIASVFFWVLFVLSAVVLIGIILLQEGKGGGLAEAFGGMGAETFGVKAKGITMFTFATAGVFLTSAVAIDLLADVREGPFGSTPAESAPLEPGAPATGGESPAAGGEVPAASGESPGASGESPAAGVESPATEGVTATPGSEVPPAGGDATDAEPPSSEPEPPEVEEPPAAGGEEPPPPAPDTPPSGGAGGG